MSTLADKFFSFDRALESHGIPPCSRWWREGLRTWLDSYEAGNALELWAAVGRGAAKSTIIYKLGLFFSLYGNFTIPEGERHFAIVLSRLKEECGKGLAIIDRWLTLLGVSHTRAGDVIELDDRPVGLRVCAASVAAASGWRAFFVGCDEFAKWATNGVDTLDAGEVRSSAIAMSATHARAPIVTMSSAWGAAGEFYDAIMSGTDATRVCLGPAPTWIAAEGHITEAECRAKEQDSRRFAREYSCEFSASASSAFDSDDVRAAIGMAVPDGARGETVVLIDPSSGGGDTFSYCLANWIVPKVARFETDSIWDRSSGRYLDVPRNDPSGARIPIEVVEEDFKPVLQLFKMGGFTGAFRGRLSADVICDAIVKLAREHGARRVYSDQFEQIGLSALFMARGMYFTSLSWTQPSKQTAAERTRFFLREKRLALPNNPTLAAQLVAFEERISPSGSLTFSGKRGGTSTDDLAMLALLAARADFDGLISGSPSHARSRPRRWPDGSIMQTGRSNVAAFFG
ncbi:MAG TPA: hypothetical protein VF316_25445 [Polyangiaceae bacterium]